MPRRKVVPDHVNALKSFAELEEYAEAFASGKLNCVLVLGRPGVGKTFCFRSRTRTHAHWFTGNATAFGLYLAAYESRDRPLVLDDVDSLIRERNSIALLKALCQSDSRKLISWNSEAPALRETGTPKQFFTSSPIAIIANEWRSLNRDVQAIEDRAHVVSFDPPSIEVHRQAATWFWDQEIFRFVGNHLHLFHEHSFRTYTLAWELDRAGMDWRKKVLSRCLTGTALLVAQVSSDSALTTQKERVHAFIAAGGGSRATFFNYFRRLRATKCVPDLPVKGKAPLSDPHDIRPRRALLRFRRQQV